MITGGRFTIVKKTPSTTAKAGKPERGAEIDALDRSGRIERFEIAIMPCHGDR
jgi:hypothetical protein